MTDKGYNFKNHSVSEADMLWLKAVYGAAPADMKVL